MLKCLDLCNWIHNFGEREVAGQGLAHAAPFVMLIRQLKATLVGQEDSIAQVNHYMKANAHMLKNARVFFLQQI